MQDFEAFEPSTLGQVAVGVIFYGLLLLTTVVSVSTIYVLIKRGPSRAVGFFVSILYAIFYLALVSQGIATLNSIQ